MAMTEIKELIDKYDIDCLVLTHAGKSNPKDSDDPFDKIIGSTALQGVADNCIIMKQSKGQTKLCSKGRLIYPSEKILTFEDGKYYERTGAGVEYEDKAPVQANVLKALEEAPMTVSELAAKLGKDKGQISRACSSLFNAYKITRMNRTDAWCLNNHES